MSIRTRLTLFVSGMLLISLLFMMGVLYYELVYEPGSGDAGAVREPPRKQMVDILFLHGVPTLILLVGGGWLVLHRALAPITALTEAAERVNSANLGERLKGSGNGDELDRLTRVFNDMMNRLEGSFGRVRDFTLHASHELKTPLTILRGEIETQLREGNLNPDQIDASAGMLDEIQRLAHIVDSLGLLAKADASQIVLERETVRLDELVGEALEDARVLGAEQGLEVELVGGEVMKVTVMGDRHRLRQLLLILVDNAVKYNERGGRIELGLGCEGGCAEVSIGNSGVGISAEQLPHVFDRFYRGDGAVKRSREGCGLGLSIAQWIAQSHGGTLEMRSGPGRLTTAVLRVPVSLP